MLTKPLHVEDKDSQTSTWRNPTDFEPIGVLQRVAELQLHGLRCGARKFQVEDPGLLIQASGFRFVSRALGSRASSSKGLDVGFWLVWGTNFSAVEGFTPDSSPSPKP